jgi:hypothetical protein
MSDRIWVVDRIERDVAIVVDDGTGASRRVPRRSLPQDVREGDVLRAPVDAGGEPDWTRATTDEALRREREDEARAAIDRLRRRDPGGDVKL